MALRFKVETLEDAVRITVKGVEVELSYHAASALCNTIFSECDQRKEFQSNKFDYWRKQGRNGHKVKVRPTNKKTYEKFLASTQSKERKPRKVIQSKPFEERTEKQQKKALLWQARRERLIGQNSKVKELQERYNIKPEKT